MLGESGVSVMILNGSSAAYCKALGKTKQKAIHFKLLKNYWFSLGKFRLDERVSKI